MNIPGKMEPDRVTDPREDSQDDRQESLLDQKWFQRFVVWGSLVVAWEILGMILGPFFLPRFTQVFISMFGAFASGDMTTLGRSLMQMFLGFGLAAVVGIPVGLLMGASRVVDYVLGIYVNALFVTSMEALLPFIIILVGTEFKFRVAVVFLFAIFFVIINTAAGVRAVDPDLLETAAAFCTPRLTVFRKIILPAALPYVIAGLRLGLGHSVKGMVIAELWVIVDTGKRLVDLGYARKLPEYFALALWIVIFGALSSQLLLILQERLTPWGETSGVLATGRRE
jgi:ABC-type nitrate/sulfonate/bicarbonate transport system permease component